MVDVNSQNDAPNLQPASNIDRDVLYISRTAFAISYTAFAALFIICALPTILEFFRNEKKFSIGLTLTSGNLFADIVAAYAPHLLLFGIAITSLIVGYRALTASGASADFVIPTQDYALLAPLVSESKADAIALYIQLSSLRGPTGFFTRLELKGLPLATIALTLFFTIIALFNPSGQFLDLAKLTLGAFIGSFVQRQVDKKIEPIVKPTDITHRKID